MVVRFIEGTKMVCELKTGSTFMFEGDVYLLTDDKEQITAVRLKDGAIAHFADVCTVIEVTADVNIYAIGG